MGAGRPRKFKKPEDMQKAIDKYFDNCPDTIRAFTKDGKQYEKPTPTISGLALYLGFNTRMSMYNYEGYSKEFLDTINKAKTKMETIYEQYLTMGSAAGPIFALKNFGWKDKQEIEQKSEITMKPSIVIGGKTEDEQ